MGYKTFFDCSGLESINLPENLTSLGLRGTFKNCSSLTSIAIPENVTNIKSVWKNAFQKIAPNAKIKVPARKLKAYKKLFKGKGQGKKVKITK